MAAAAAKHFLRVKIGTRIVPGSWVRSLCACIPAVARLSRPCPYLDGTKNIAALRLLSVPAALALLKTRARFQSMCEKCTNKWIFKPDACETVIKKKDIIRLCCRAQLAPKTLGTPPATAPKQKRTDTEATSAATPILYRVDFDVYNALTN